MNDVVTMSRAIEMAPFRLKKKYKGSNIRFIGLLRGIADSLGRDCFQLINKETGSKIPNPLGA